MALITRCPSCGTAFRITPLDLQAHGGDVRCGRCEHIFSGYASLAKVGVPEAVGATVSGEIDEVGRAGTAPEPGPQAPEKRDTSEAEKTFSGTTDASGDVEIPLVSGYAERRGHAESPVSAQTLPDERIKPASVLPPVSPEHIGCDGGKKDAVTGSPGAARIPNLDMREKPRSQAGDRSGPFYDGVGQEELPPPFDETSGAASESLDQKYLAPQDDAFNSAHGYRDLLTWGIASFFLLFALAAQAVYIYRAEILAMTPSARPYIDQYCKLLQCSMPSMPQYAKLLNIESSDMRADPQRQGVNALTALVRNYASYPQAYPLVQVTLIDAQDRPLASRIFPPPAYLEKDADFVEPIAPNGEFNIGLHVDSGDLDAAGYRLLLLYPSS